MAELFVAYEKLNKVNTDKGCSTEKFQCLQTKEWNME